MAKNVTEKQKSRNSSPAKRPAGKAAAEAADPRGRTFVQVRISAKALAIAHAILAASNEQRAEDNDGERENDWDLAALLEGSLHEGLAENEKLWLNTSALDEISTGGADLPCSTYMLRALLRAQGYDPGEVLGFPNKVDAGVSPSSGKES